LSTNSRK